MNLKTPTLRLLGTAICLGLPLMAQAMVNTGEDAELMLYVFENAGEGSAEVSYTKDLGIVAKDFWVQAQQNGGYSKFIELDSGDANFAKFLSATSNTASKRRWGIFSTAFWKTQQNGVPSTFAQAYFTLGHGSSVAGQQASFLNVFNLDTSIGMVRDSWAQQNFSSGSVLKELNSSAQANDNTHPTQDNGSSFSSKASGDKGYAQSLTLFTDPVDFAKSGSCFMTKLCVANEVGQSAWFYKIDAPAGLDEVEQAPFDEFDNGNGTAGNDGYWGFAFNATTNKYVLSYTLAPFTPTALANTADGRLRLSTTDYASGFASRQIAVPTDEFSSPIPLAAPVPEPSSWGLMGLGIALMLASARRGAKASHANRKGALS